MGDDTQPLEQLVTMRQSALRIIVGVILAAVALGAWNAGLTAKNRSQDERLDQLEDFIRETAQTNRQNTAQIQQNAAQIEALANQTRTYQEGAIRQNQAQDRDIDANRDDINELFQQNPR